MLSIVLSNLTPNTNNDNDNDNATHASIITWKVAMLIVFILSQQWYYVNHDHDDSNNIHDSNATHAMEISITFWIAYYYYYDHDHVDNKKDIILFCISFLPLWINETHLIYILHMHHAKLSTSSSSIANNYQLTCDTTTTATPAFIGLRYDNLLNYYDRFQWFTNFHYHDCYYYCKDLCYHTTISINSMQLVATHHDRNRSCYDFIHKRHHLIIKEGDRDMIHHQMMMIKKVTRNKEKEHNMIHIHHLMIILI